MLQKISHHIVSFSRVCVRCAYMFICMCAHCVLVDVLLLWGDTVTTANLKETPQPLPSPPWHTSSNKATPLIVPLPGPNLRKPSQVINLKTDINMFYILHLLVGIQTKAVLHYWAVSSSLNSLNRIILHLTFDFMYLANVVESQRFYCFVWLSKSSITLVVFFGRFFGESVLGQPESTSTYWKKSFG